MKKPRKNQITTKVKCLYCKTPIEHVLRVDHGGKARMVAKCKCE